MSSGELLNEYKADLAELIELTHRYRKSEPVLRNLRKHRKEPLGVVSKIFNTKRHNTYLGMVYFCQIGVGQNKRWDYTAIHTGLIETKKGTCALMFYSKSQQALKILPHFFERYKERVYDLVDWRARNELNVAKDIVDVMKVYLKRNPIITWIETNGVFRNKTHIFGPVNDGVALLEWDNDTKVLQANTFITNDMLDEKQKEMVKYAKIYLNLPAEQRQRFKFPDFIEQAKKTDDKSE